MKAIKLITLSSASCTNNYSWYTVLSTRDILGNSCPQCILSFHALTGSGLPFLRPCVSRYYLIDKVWLIFSTCSVDHPSVVQAKYDVHHSTWGRSFCICFDGIMGIYLGKRITRMQKSSLGFISCGMPSSCLISKFVVLAKDVLCIPIAEKFSK